MHIVSGQRGRKAGVFRPRDNIGGVDDGTADVERGWFSVRRRHAFDDVFVQPQQPARALLGHASGLPDIWRNPLPIAVHDDLAHRLAKPEREIVDLVSADRARRRLPDAGDTHGSEHVVLDDRVSCERIERRPSLTGFLQECPSERRRACWIIRGRGRVVEAGPVASTPRRLISDMQVAVTYR